MAGWQAASNTLAAPPINTIGDVPLEANLRFENISLEDGLSQNAVLSIYQDNQGFIWVGTQDGLNRYDGYGFTVFKHIPEDDNSLGNSSILALYEDNDQILWIGTWGGGLTRYDRQTGQFLRYRHDPEDPQSLADNLVSDIIEDSQGRLWVATMGGLDLLDRQAGTFQHFKANQSDHQTLSSDYISVILEDPSGQLWIGTGGFGNAGSGLNLFDPQSGQAVRYTADPSDPNTLGSDNISSLAFDPDGNLWIGTGGYGITGNGLYRLDALNGEITGFRHKPGDAASISSNEVITLMVDSAGYLWIGTWGAGLDRIDPRQARPGFYHYRHDTFNAQSISADVIWSLFEDRSGVLWVGTINGGLNKVNPQMQRFRLYRHHPNQAESLGFDVVSPIEPDGRGGAWIGTLGGGLNHFDLFTGRFTRYKHDPTDITSLANDTLLALLLDKNGALWVGSMGGLHKMDQVTGNFVRFQNDPADPNSLVSDNVVALEEDPAGRIWVGTMSGLDWYEPGSERFYHIKIPQLTSAVDLFIDVRGDLWVGTWGQGIFRLDLGTVGAGDVRYTHFQYDPENPRSISDNAVWAIYEDSSGILWMGTQRGLNRFVREEGAFDHFTESDGLANNTIMCLQEDQQGHLWISTNAGLSRFDTHDLEFKNFDATEGLQSDEFNSGSCARGPNGELYFGGVNGFNVFLPDQIKDNPAPPAVAVTTFRIFNEPVDARLLNELPLQLSYRHNFFAFEFVALDYHAPTKNQYAYMLEGFDTDWIFAGSRRYASYTNLNGGDYVFRVKASNNDGVWNEQVVSIPIHITPPFWQLWGFQVGAGFALIAIVIGGVRWRLDSVRAQNRQLEGLVDKRTVELRLTNEQLEHEIIQRKRAEEELARRASEELQQSEARFRAMFNDAAVGIGLLTLDRVIIEANPTLHHMIGAAPDQLTNMQVETLIYPEDRHLDALYYAEIAAGKRDSFSVEKRYVRMDGAIFWGRLNLSLVRDMQGKPKFLVGMMQDIDDEKRAGERLVEQEREYRRMLQQRVEERTHELLEANLRLQHEMEQRQRVEQTLAHKAAEEAVVNERTRLARELHDAVTQTLFAASLIAEVLPDLWKMDPAEAEQSLQELRQLTRGALAEMRTLLLELRPAVLTQTRIEDLLRQLCDALIGRGRLPIQLNIQGQRRLPPEVQMALYRITQESLNNIFKYARAAQVWVDVQLAPKGVYLSIRDNGVGFDIQKIKPNSLGLRIMRERADAIEAELEISSVPGQGTQVTLIWNSQDIEQEQQ